MNTIEDRLRELGTATSGSGDLDAVILGGKRLRRRRVMTRVVAPLAAAAIVATAIIVPVVGSNPTSSSEASAFLLTIGEHAGAQSDIGATTAKYWYVKTESQFGTCPVTTREIWIGHHRKGVIRQVFPDGLHNEPIGSGHAAAWVSWDELWQLPTDADALYTWVYDTAGDAGPDKFTEMWTVVWDLLRESPAPPALRQALYDVAARIPGVSITGETVDALGRSGTRIERRGPWGVDSYIIDATTGAILERQGRLDGSVISGRDTYVTREAVEAIPAYALPKNDLADRPVPVEELVCSGATVATAEAVAPSAAPQN